MTDPRPKTEEEKALSLIEAAEARMRQAENFTWTVPGLAITAQAFLLNVALDSSSTPWRRLVAAIAGLATIAAASQFMGKHVFNFDVYEAVIDRERLKIGLPRLTRDYLIEDLDSFPCDTNLRRRQWLRDEEPGRWRPITKWLKRRRYTVVYRWKTVWVWSAALLVFALIDLGICVWSFAEAV